MNTAIDRSNEIIQRLLTFINEEKFIKDFSSYQLNKIEMYVQFASQLASSSQEEQREALNLLAEYKKNENEKSVLGRLIPPIIAFKQTIDRDPSEENELFDLVSSLLQDFFFANRWAIIEYIADQILSFFPVEVSKLRNHPNIVDILRYKIEAKEKLVGKKETKDILRLIIEIDRKDAVSRVKLAKLIQNEEPQEAKRYLREAAEIFAKENKIDKLEEIWKQLVDENFEDIKFFERLERILSNGKHFSFLASHFPLLVEKYREIGDWDMVIVLLKKVITGALEQEKREENEKKLKDVARTHKKRESKNITKLRNDLIVAYRNKYKNHTLLDRFLSLSNLSNPKVPVTMGIANFEKYIVFDINNYVYHRSRGVGKIKEINDKFITIDFKNIPDQRMSLDLAISNLQPLHKDHIWAMYYESYDKLKEIFEKNIQEFFRILLTSYNKKITVAQIKKELTEKKLISAKDWNRWWQETRKLLKENPLFGFNPKKRNEIVMWDRELSYAEELESRFDSTKEWDKKLEIAIESLTVSPELTEKATESIAEYFLNVEESLEEKAKYENKKKKLDIHLFFELLKEVSSGSAILKERKAKKEDIIHLLKSMDDEEIIHYFEDTKIQEFKKQIIKLIIQNKENYTEILKKLLLKENTKVHKFIIDELVKLGQQDTLRFFFNEVFRKYKEYPELFLWLSKNILYDTWKKEGKDGYDWITANKFEVALQVLRFIKFFAKSEQKGAKYKNQAIEILFGTQNINLETLKNSLVKDLISEGEEEFITKMYIIFKDIPYIPQAHKENLEKFINTLKPDINLKARKDFEEESEEFILPPEDIIYSTKEAIERLRQHLDHLIYVEMPENAKEIGEAQEKGDLRENAEYKAALERQDKLRAEIKKLEEELKKVKPIDETKIRTDLVSIGTKVTLKDSEGNIIVYTILGPWDTNPELNIISYASPLGKALIGKKVGDVARFSGEREFTIQSIEKAVF